MGEQGDAVMNVAEQAQPKVTQVSTEVTEEAGRLVNAAREEAERTLIEVRKETNRRRQEVAEQVYTLITDTATEAEKLLADARRDADQARKRSEELHERITGDIEQLYEQARQEAAETMRSTGDRCDELIHAAEEQFARAQARAKEILSEANSEADKIWITAVKKGEKRLREAEHKRLTLLSEAEEAERELEILMRRREEVHAEIERAHDVLEALEPFEDLSLDEYDGIETGGATGGLRSDDESSEAGTSAYEDELRRLASQLRQLRAERGNPTMRAIEARAKKLFGERASVSIATQSAAFNAKYVGVNKVMLLVRTLLSWDEYGEERAAPHRRSGELIEWRAQWVTISTLRPPRRR